MATHAGVGVSHDQDSQQAGADAAALALKKIEGHAASILFVFASAHFDQGAVLRGVKKISGATPVVGASGAATITPEGVFERSVVVAAVSSDTASFTTGIARDIRGNVRDMARGLAADIASRSTGALRLFFLFADIFSGDGESIARGSIEALGRETPLFGGAAADGFMFDKTYQYFNDEAAVGSIVGIGISGTMTVGFGAGNGWMPIGLPMRATAAAGTELQRLDERTAVSVYEDYFGKSADELRRGSTLVQTALLYPLGLKAPGQGGEYLVRWPYQANADGALMLTAGVPEGADVRLMIGAKDRALAAAKDAAGNALKEFGADGASPKCVFVISCVAREKLFGKDVSEELRAVAGVFGPDIPVVGFYAYGAWAPSAGEGRNIEKSISHFYNNSIVVLAMGD